MSHTIRNERTKGWLDKLALKRRTKKLIRDIRNEDFWMDFDERLSLKYLDESIYEIHPRLGRKRESAERIRHII